MVDRMLFFSDAVFAIVLTLLVLELRPPEGHDLSDDALWAGLAGMWRSYLAFFVSFALVGLWWSVHMRATRTLARFDAPTALCNLVFLSVIALMPFVAAVWGENVLSPAAMVVYWSANAAAAFCMTLLFVVSTRGGGKLLAQPFAPGERAARLVQSLAPGLAFLTGAVLAGSGHLILSWYCWALIPLIGLSGRVFRRARKAPPARA
jgi:uncharacterized membrane protein